MLPPAHDRCVDGIERDVSIADENLRISATG